MSLPWRLAIVVLVLVAAGVVARMSDASSTAFRGAVESLSPAMRQTMTGRSWHRGCPVALGSLRLVRARYWGFDGRVHDGRLVVNRDVARSTLSVLERLYAARFPIRRMVPVDAYGASDFASIEADNTSAFNCRYVDGTTRWSNHAYGRAIDINPIENPYVGTSGTTSHRASIPYLNRGRVRKGMAVEGGPLVAAFDAVGWGWGGRWSGAKDYQHFSSDGD